MVTESARTFALVVSAIKNLCELKGSTSKEILNYLQNVYNVSSTSGRRQMLAALKRGVAHGILKKNGGHYILPTNNETKCQEIAAQEINLLDFCRRRSGQQKAVSERGSRCRRKKKKRKCKCKRTRSARRKRRSRKKSCHCKRARRKKKKKCRCGGLGKCGRKRANVEEPLAEKPLEQSTEINDSAVSDSASSESFSSRGD